MIFRSLTSRCALTPVRSFIDSKRMIDEECSKSFGIVSEYNQRANKKLNGTHLMPEKHNFFVTSARPGNFGEHLDFKNSIDNWFEENRYLSGLLQSSQ
jgi:hypothetical protein